MSYWQLRTVPFKFQLSDWVLFSVGVPLQVRQERLLDLSPPVAQPLLPSEPLMVGSQGYLIRGLPVSGEWEPVSTVGDYHCYVSLLYPHCYIDLSIGFEAYQAKFSSKTRSTLKRKVRKYADHCGGSLCWRAYTEPDRLDEFFAHARRVSRLTYQEKLFDGGIPGSESFVGNAKSLAARNHLRAWVLFDGERPVSYLYCPVDEGVLIYAYLGYDPDYMKLSVGTVLQWLALEQLFNEGRFHYFDFTEGRSAHKQLFATHQRQCVNLYLLRRGLRNSAVLYGQLWMNRFSGALGRGLDRYGLKAKVRRLLRFA